MNAANPDSHTISWCASLPETENRIMLDIEIAEIQSEIDGFSRKITVAVAIPPVVFCLIFLLYRNLPADGNFSQDSLLTITSISTIALMIPIEIVFIRDCLIRSKGLKADLNVGIVRRFEGELKSIDPIDHTQAYLLTRSFLRPDLDAIQEIELLPATLRLYKVNGQKIRWWKAASVEQTALLPEIADIAAQWLEPVGESEEGVLFAGKRALSQPELTELGIKQRRMWLKYAVPAILLTLLFFLGLSSWDSKSNPLSLSRKVRLAVIGVLALTNDVLFISSAVRAYKISQDKAQASIIIVRRPLGPDEKRSNDSAESEFRSYEFLPISRMLWTEEGLPANWRRLRL